MSDNRHQKRVLLLQQLFASTFDDKAVTTALKNTAENSSLWMLLQDLESIDKIVQKVADERPLSEINKIDLTILRIIVFESNHKNTPKKVLINEAIELAKKFGSQNSPSFVNAVLAKLLLDQK